MDEGFVSLICPKCGSENEATPDLAGQTAECPACGERLSIPDNRSSDGISRHTSEDVDPDSVQAMNSRTIRIELGEF